MVDVCKRNVVTRLFSEIGIGEMFEFKKEMYIKIPLLFEKNVDPYGVQIAHNAICVDPTEHIEEIGKMSMALFSDYDSVVPKQCEIIIK